MRLQAICLAFFFTATAHAQVGNNSNLLDPNLASADELETVPHMNKELVEALVAARPVNSTSQLNEILGASLSEEHRSEVYGKLFRQIDLNNASDADIMLIPGMSKKMAHEFDEYRPYSSLEQFRREIGKYVDEDEVARLEQYIYIPMNLNTASEEAFLTIPGMTKRMAHEFDEYRPYSDLEQFRREIGKYVDDDEVSRLESYLTLQ